MCPPDGCLATGCVGSLVSDKQPVACGIDTVNADVGQTYTLTYAVSPKGQKEPCLTIEVYKQIVLSYNPISGLQLCKSVGNSSASDLNHKSMQPRRVPLR